MKSRAFVIASLVSAIVFAVILCLGCVLHCTGPVRLSERLWLDSGYGYWLVFFDGDDLDSEGTPCPYFNGMIALGNGDGLSVDDSGVLTTCVTDRRWQLWGEMGGVRERYVDADGVTHLAVTYYLLPGIFYRKHQYIESRLLTFAFRGWLLLGLFAWLPGIWAISRVNRTLRTRALETLTSACSGLPADSET